MPSRSAILCWTLFGATAAAQPLLAQQGPGDWSAVEQALGRKGALQPAGVIKFSFPRSDLSVALGTVILKPALALGSWVAFMPVGNQALAMGDLVLTQDEVGPVIQKLQAGGVEQTALHNHLLHETPHVMYLHVMGQGDAVHLAAAIHSALLLTGTPEAPPAPAAPGSGAPGVSLDTAGIARALGHEGKLNGVVYQVSVPRAETVTLHGVTIPPAMGVATALNFQPTGGGKAAVTGDFVLLASEVNPVIRALSAHGIAVTALHQHLLDATPVLYFMHFWANDDALAVARGLRGALDLMH